MAEEVATPEAPTSEKARQLELLSAELRKKQIELDGKEKALDVKLEAGEKLLGEINNEITIQDGRLRILKEKVVTETELLTELQSAQAKVEEDTATLIKQHNEQVKTNQDGLIRVKGAITQAREELAGVHKELKETQDYLKTQEQAVTDVVEAYNVQLGASHDRIDQLTKQEATIQDNITTLEEREKEILTNVDDKLAELGALNDKTKQAQEAYDNGITKLRTSIEEHKRIALVWEEKAEKSREEAEQFTTYIAKERKAIEVREANVKRAEREVGEDRRRLQSDKAVLGTI